MTNPTPSEKSLEFKLWDIVMHCLELGIHSEKCIIRQLCHRRAVWHSLWLLGHKPVRYVTVQNNTRLDQAQEKIMQSRDMVYMRSMRLPLA
uniref:Uncharacterized protein n=1 Tax=Rhinolophus ferrumequinum TaxID=59479 RepID=A0A671F0J2_RHIFE